MEKQAQSFDVCIVCALPEEVRAFLEVLGQHSKDTIEEHISPRYHSSYRFATIKNNKNESLNLHISWLPRYGPQEMTLHLSRVLEECRPRLAIMTGICAGNAQHVQLGDLIVAERVFTYDSGKFTLDEQGRSVHLHDTMTYQLEANILQFLGLFDEWKPLVAHLKRPSSPSETKLKQHEVRCHIKAMASGNAVRADHPFEDVQAPVRGTVAIDMEGAAFGLVMNRHPLIRWLIVKGVCDYADQDKNDAYHDYAAYASALYGLSFIQAYATSERLPQLDEQVTGSVLSLTGRQQRTKLLKWVYQLWIKGLLEPSLHQAPWIDLNLQEHPDALLSPWKDLIQELDSTPHPLPVRTSLVEVFDEADGELLLLGEPGAGKTTLLLELTRILLERAKSNVHCQLPIVFNLASWAPKCLPLADWFLEELKNRYGVSPRTGAALLAANQILPLLDGLDEVTEGSRTLCVQRINVYYQQTLEKGSVSLVVCCRTKEYAALSTRVILHKTVSILPLSHEQIEQYLQKMSGHLGVLQHALHHDTELAELARQPLMLSIFVQAYQGATPKDLPEKSTRENILQSVFASYVKRMLSRRRRLLMGTEEQICRWLTFLAGRMHQHDVTILFLEELQLDWLPLRYRLLCELNIGLLVGPLGVVFVELLIAIPVGLLGEVLFRDHGALLHELIFGLLIGLVFGMFSMVIFGSSARIRPRESLTKSYIGTWLGAVLISVLIVGPLLFQPTDPVSHRPVIGPAIGLLIFLLIAGLLFWLLFGWVGKLIAGHRLIERFRLFSNEGMWRSAKNGLLVGLGVALLGGLLVGLTFGLEAGLGFAPLVIPLVWLLAGLAAFVQHFILRLWLWRIDRLPWKLVSFLNQATERLLLHKIGGSYIFVHRLLLDYFASLEKKES